MTATATSADVVPAASPKRRRRASGWLAVVPLLVFVAIAFGIPALAMLNGAFTVKDQATGATSYSAANLTDSLQGAYFTALVGSVKLSAVSAGIATVLGLPLAQAVVTSRFRALREAVLTASGVLANFGGVPLAFAFVATLGNSGVLTRHLGLADLGWSLYSFWGLTITYLYFLIPLMVLVMSPALEGLKPQWAEAAENLGASRWHYWRYVAGPVLAPNFLGSVLLLFCSAFSAYATADALVGDSFPLIPTQISNVLSGNVLSGQENLGAALAFDMVLIVLPLTVVYQLLQRRTSKWLA